MLYMKGEADAVEDTGTDAALVVAGVPTGRTGFFLI